MGETEKREVDRKGKKHTGNVMADRGAGKRRGVEV